MNIKLKYYCANLLFIYAVLVFYLNNKYYVDFLKPETRCVLCAYAAFYTIGGFVYYWFVDEKKVSETKGYIALKAIRKLLGIFIRYISETPLNQGLPTPISRVEKTNLLFLLVKIYFFPIMINFLFNNFSSIIKCYIAWTVDYQARLTPDAFIHAFYFLLINLLLFVDCLIFTFGYAVDAEVFDNKIRSVEPTILGWAVTLLCYPPFNSIPNFYIANHINDSVVFGSEAATLCARFIVLILFTVYVWSSVALGMKASNLTNRGIVASGPYAYVRHPAYLSKNLAWWISILAVNTLPAYTGMLFFSFLYFLRAITEERHLIADPDYQEYCRLVKYRFIPGLF